MKRYHSIAELEETGRVQAATSIRHGGISLKPYHSLNLGDSVGDDPTNVWANRRALFDQVGLELCNFVYCRQIHSPNVVCVNQSDASSQTYLAEADAMITTSFNLALGIFTADCVPVFIFDPVTPAIGIAHAGWRGTLAKIADKTINAMQNHLGTSPLDCMVHLGPSIQRCCYIVSEELADQFEFAFGASVRSGAQALSLQDANVHQLTQAGVRSDTISGSPFCTACRTDLFYSHRAEAGKTGRMLSFIRLRCIKDE
jgi:YfiH family protein